MTLFLQPVNNELNPLIEKCKVKILRLSFILNGCYNNYDKKCYFWFKNIFFICFLLFLFTKLIDCSFICLTICKLLRINKNETLEIAIREKIPLNASKMIRNPNYSPTKDSLCSDSGKTILTILFTFFLFINSIY